MLSLDDPAWRTLASAYPEEDIPALLRQLSTFPRGDDRAAEPYFTLWGALCHQGSTYPASYAAVPHIVDAIRAAPERAHWSALALVVAIELSRLGFNGGSGAVPENLAAPYRDAIAKLPEVVGLIARLWETDPQVRAAAAALALGHGHAALASAILSLGPEELAEFPAWLENR